MMNNTRTQALGHARAARLILMRMQKTLASKATSDERALAQAKTDLTHLQRHTHDLNQLLARTHTPGTFANIYKDGGVILVSPADCDHPEIVNNACITCGTDIRQSA